MKHKHKKRHVGVLFFAQPILPSSEFEVRALFHVHRSRIGSIALGGTTRAPAFGCFCSAIALPREPSPGIRASNRNGRDPFPLPTAGVCDWPDRGSCALAMVAASASTNATASLDMTDFSSREPEVSRRNGASGWRRSTVARCPLPGGHPVVVLSPPHGRGGADVVILGIG